LYRRRWQKHQYCHGAKVGKIPSGRISGRVAGCRVKGVKIYRSLREPLIPGLGARLTVLNTEGNTTLDETAQAAITIDTSPDRTTILRA
jgi:hypothetical protein